MKKAMIMISLSLIPRMLVAQEIDLASLVGEDWYGLYINGQKAGYASFSLILDDAGAIDSVEDVRFKIAQAGRPQDVHMFSKRRYAANGDLVSVVVEVTDPVNVTRYVGRVDGDTLVLESFLAGAAKTETFPKPRESLQDAIHNAYLLGGDPSPGDELVFSRFEPMFKKEIWGKSRIVGIEERLFDGAPTTVFAVRTEEYLAGAPPFATGDSGSAAPEAGAAAAPPMVSTSLIAEGGTVLEGTVAGTITMRLEPKEVAMDVDYSNDVIVSNAAMVDKPIEEPRSRDSLKLVLKGPLESAHLFIDDRQRVVHNEDGFDFEATRLSLDGFEPVALPIDDEDVRAWQKPTTFVQSDDPKLVAKAEEIVGDETDSFEIAARLCHWVHDNVETTYSARLSNALEVLANPRGDCTEHSILFIGLARAAGLPAREVAGLVYVGDQPGFYFHQWAKVWIGKWIDVDPTFDQPLADVTHIKLAEGDLLQQALLTPIIGRIRVHVVE